MSLAPWTCARPRAKLSKGHDSIIHELKSTASKSLVVNPLGRITNIAIQKLQTLIDTRKSESHKHATQHWPEYKWVYLARNTLLHMTILSNLIGHTAIVVRVGVHKSMVLETAFCECVRPGNKPCAVGGSGSHPRFWPRGPACGGH